MFVLQVKYEMRVFFDYGFESGVVLQESVEYSKSIGFERMSTCCRLRALWLLGVSLCGLHKRAQEKFLMSGSVGGVGIKWPCVFSSYN